MTGWLDPSPEQLDDARAYLAGAFDDNTRTLWALDYLGARVERVAAGDFDHNDLRRAVAMYRVYEEVR